MSSHGYVKDVSGHIPLPAACEMPYETQVGTITPNDRFFVCHEEPTPRLDATAWRLELAGDGLAQPLTLDLAALQAMPQHSVTAVIECAGNHRQLFEEVMGEPLDRRPDVTEIRWHLGGVGMAEWRGVPLAHVLRLAGIAADACHVMPIGLDRGKDEDPEGIRVPLPAAKALDPDTLIALEMNGEPLPPDHGFPARLIVPGWVGTYSIKWLGRIEVTRDHVWVARNTRMYILIGPDWPQDQYAPARGAPVTRHPIRSSLALPWPARLAPGRHRLHGYARGNDHAITQVAWSADRGATWQDAAIVSTPARYAWTQFAFDWVATPGEHALMTRATDASGASQLLTQPFNDGGYLFSMVHPHPITVA